MDKKEKAQPTDKNELDQPRSRVLHLEEGISYEEKVRKVLDLARLDDHLLAPVDLNFTKMRIVKLNNLKWSNHEVPPEKMKLANTGNGVILSAKWREERPYISGGPFFSNYVFAQLHFHWGVNDMGGSEHTADGISSPMELHVVYFKVDYLKLSDAMKEVDGIVILVYFFKLQSCSNPQLDFVIRNLPSISKADDAVQLDDPQTPLQDLVRPFKCDYFLYSGSLKSGNDVMNRILWIINRDPIGIASEQTAEFRKLRDSKNQPLLSFNRVATENHGYRNIFHVNPSGRNYATLGPILPLLSTSQANRD